MSTPVEAGRVVELRRLHPLTPFVRGWKALAVIVAILGQQAAEGRGGSPTPMLIVLGAVVPLALVYGWVAWLFTRFGFDGEELLIESGALFRRSRRVRLDRLQAVDVVRPLLGRLLGLAELRLEVVGGRSSEGGLAYLGEDAALRLRAELLARAAGVRAAEGEEAPEAPEVVLHKVPAGRLVGSVLLSMPTILTLGLAVVLLVGVAITGEPGFAFAILPVLLPLGGGMAQRLISEFDFTVAGSPDGLRLRRGLLETRAQTVPPGRVQALRIVSPLLWRSRGWVRVEVSVAGYGKESASESSALLPVAPRHEAYDLVRLVLQAEVGPHPGPEAVPLTPVPARARSIDPVAWRGLAVGADDRVFVSTRGVLRREMDVVPHAKAQSVRVTQGPLQRRLGLASLHLDLPPGIRPYADHRDAAEAGELLRREVELARAARARALPERWAERREG
ncbi:PH domain-containing protein [Motilibacter deserti]|uniref:PH domain-containing protein n=1 Tax=Motilibacter deserti TaxID=2714956 RepID=A0ABX0GYC7_9ACTN|nr:PH domain-containing protein [Motilibacter deserti]